MSPLTHAEAQKVCVRVGAELCEKKDAERLIGGERRGETFNQHHTGHDLGTIFNSSTHHLDAE